MQNKENFDNFINEIKECGVVFQEYVFEKYLEITKKFYNMHRMIG